MAARDRWHQLADAIQDSNLPASDKSVFRYLLDRSEYGIAVMLAKWTPTETTVGRKTSYSRRQVQYSVAHLRRHGWLVTKRASRKLAYEFDFGTMCDCTGRVHEPRRKGATESPDRRNSCAGIGATDRRNAAAQTPDPTERQREGRVKRGHLFDDDWWPADTIGAEINREIYPPATDISRKGQPLATLTVWTKQARPPAPGAVSQPRRTPDLSASWPGAA